jgi:hypothetical protein
MQCDTRKGATMIAIVWSFGDLTPEQEAASEYTFRNRR